MNHPLISEIEVVFGQIQRPSTIYVIPKSIREIAPDELMIQADFGNLSKEDMTYEQSSMMICDHVLISDQALLYFLPVLARNTFSSGALFSMLISRLKLVKQENLSCPQKLTLKKLIEELELREKLLDYED